MNYHPTELNVKVIRGVFYKNMIFHLVFLVLFCKEPQAVCYYYFIVISQFPPACRSKNIA